MNERHQGDKPRGRKEGRCKAQLPHHNPPINNATDCSFYPPGPRYTFALTPPALGPHAPEPPQPQVWRGSSHNQQPECWARHVRRLSEGPRHDCVRREQKRQIIGSFSLTRGFNLCAVGRQGAAWLLSDGELGSAVARRDLAEGNCARKGRRGMAGECNVLKGKGAEGWLGNVMS